MPALAIERMIDKCEGDLWLGTYLFLLRVMMMDRGLTMERVAGALPYGRGTLSAILNGRKPDITYEDLDRIDQAIHQLAPGGVIFE